MRPLNQKQRHHNVKWQKFGGQDIGTGNDFCTGGPCVKVKVNLGPSERTTFEYLVTISSKSFTGGPILTMLIHVSQDSQQESLKKTAEHSTI